jgi:hypothetical protein
MKVTRWLWAAGLVGAGMAAGAALALAARGGMALTELGGGEVRSGIHASADALHELLTCDDDCVRSRGAAALVVLGQRPPP